MESNPTAGKRDNVVVIVDGAKEEEFVCCYREDYNGYNDFHPNMIVVRTGVVSR